MDWSGWAVVGFAATAVLSAIMVAAQLSGLSRMDIPFLLGSIFAEDPDRARVLGVGIHLLNGQAFALLYALGFAVVDRSGALLGAAFGLIHGLAALTLIIPLLPAIHPKMASEREGPASEAVLEPPGLLGLHYGRETPLVTLVAHVVFGVILGVFLTPG
jgi:hypothetical protein